MKTRSINIVFIILAFFSGHMAQAQSSRELKVWKIEDLRQAIEAPEGPTIFNFWATFCKPCIEEIPHFQQLVKKYDSAGVRLVLVSLDMKESYPDKIRTFASKRKFTAPIVFLDETNADLFCPAVDESWSGAIPATLFVNPKNGYRKFFEEEMGKKQFEEEIRAMLQTEPTK